jgi:hypothetical protein
VTFLDPQAARAAVAVDAQTPVLWVVANSRSTSGSANVSNVP